MNPIHPSAGDESETDHEAPKDESRQANLDAPTLIPTWDSASTLAPTSDLTIDGDEHAKKFLNTWSRSESIEGESIGSYHRLKRVGEWRYGSLYIAEHTQLHRRVRLITLDAPRSENPELKKWFVSRSIAIASIHDPTVASAVLECDEIGSAVFICLPARNNASKNFLLESAQRVTISSHVEPLSHAFYQLLGGLRAFHDQGLIHGRIDSRHLVAGDRIEDIQFDPFSTGIPGAEFLDESGFEIADLAALKQQDYQNLARAFLATLLGRSMDEIPAALRWRWIIQRIPFAPKRLAVSLANLARSGTANQRFDSLMNLLNETRHAPFSKMPWSDRVMLMFRNALVLVLICLVFLPVCYLSLSIVEVDPITLLFRLFVLAFIVLPVVGIFIPRPALGFDVSRILVDTEGGIPTLRQRLLREIGRVGSVLGLMAVLALITRWAIPRLLAWFAPEQSQPDLGWEFYSFLMLLPSALLACGIAFFFQGRMFHDWLSNTTWVRRSTSSNEPILQVETANIRQGFLGSPYENPDAHKQLAECIDGITIDQELGIGGMGIVYRGIDQSLQRPVALKVISAFTTDTEEIIQRFRREAQLGSTLNHPNIAKVYRVGLWQDRPFMAMEFVDGETLQQIVKREGPASAEQAWKWIRQAASGLQEADRQGIIHRDIKPANLMVQRDGLVKLMDFGISKSFKDIDSNADLAEIVLAKNSLRNHDPLGELTRVGALLGTPNYMSPEQSRCEPLDRRSDIYSLGLTLYFLLAGRPAFEGSMYEVMMQQCNEQPPPLPAKKLNRAQQQVLDQMLAKSKSDRFPDYETLIAALDASKPEEMRLPSTGRRFGAMVTDSMLMLPLFLVVGLFQGGMQMLLANYASEMILEAIGAVAGFLAMIAYFVWSTVIWGGTPGHRMLGLKVLRSDGGKVGWKEAFLRLLGKYPFFFFSALFSLPLLSQVAASLSSVVGSDWLGWGSIAIWIVSYFVVRRNNATHRKAIHDYLAGTRIVYAKKGVFDFDLEKFFGSK